MKTRRDTGTGRPRSVELQDARALRALAHPTRLKLVGLLRLQGPLTATQAARELGETPQRCTFHLGQLAKYGLVEEAGGGRGRERPWRATASFTSWPNVLTEQEAAAAGQLLEAVVVEQHFEAVMGWVERKGEEPRGVAGGGAAERRGALPDRRRARGDGQDIWSLFEPYLARGRAPELRPDGARPVTVLNLAFPRRSASEAAGG